MARLRCFIALTLVLVVCGQAWADVTPYLEPLRAQHQRLIRLRGTMEQVFQARPWDAARAQAVGTEFLNEARATRRLIGEFCRAKTRKLATEFDEINASISIMGDNFMMYRTMKGAAAPVATAADENSVRSESDTLLRDYALMKFDERFGIEGLGEILTAGSAKEALNATVEKALPELREKVGQEMERLTGLRFYDRRSLGTAMRAYVRRQVERGVAKLLVKITSNELVIEWAAGVLIRWIGPKLKEALRQKGNLDERTRISLQTLETARRNLNAFSGTADLSKVSREVRRAEGAIAATKFLQKDLARAGRQELSTQLEQAIGRLKSTLTLTAIRFPARVCAEEIPDVDRALAQFDRELQRLIAMPVVAAPVAQQPGAQPTTQVVPVVPAGPPSPAPRQTAQPAPAIAPEDELAGSWSFGRENGPLLCTLQLTKTAGAHGFVIRGCHPNESFWRLESPDTVVFLHSDGTITSRLTRVTTDYWKGPYIPTAQVPLQGITHYIRRAASAIAPPAAVPSAAAPAAAPTGSRDWVVYINMEDFTCCRYDPGWRDRYPNFGPDETPRTLSITFLSSAQKDPKKRIVSQPFKTHAEAKAWLCNSHKVVRYGGGTIARVAGIIVVLGGICPANSPD